MLKIHYHSDCSFFAGCENMLVNFFSSTELKEKYNLSFSYRYTRVYSEQFKKRINTEIQIFPLFFPTTMHLYETRFPILGIIFKISSFIISIILSPSVVLFQFFYLLIVFWRINPDILHINNGNYPGALSARVAVYVARLLRIPRIVFVVNNIAVDYSKPSRWVHYIFDIFIVKWVSRFITGSSFASLRLANVLGLDSHKISSIHNGISLRFQDEDKQETKLRLGISNFNGVIFAVVSILRENKGHLILLKAVKSILDRFPHYSDKIKILIEGQGNLRLELESYIEENLLGNVCILVGSEDNVMNLMNAMDVLILPSISNEDFPNVILEAMGFGKSVIASKLAGTPEQIQNHINGILVEPGNVEQLADAIIYMVNHENERGIMGRKAKEIFARQFEYTYAVKNYIELYDSLLKEEK